GSGPKCAWMTDLLLRTTKIMVSIPAAAASSTAYCIIGLAATGSISFGRAFVVGSILVPKPAAGITAFVILLKSVMGGEFLRDLDNGPFKPSRLAEPIPISFQQFSVSGGKPRGAISSPERIPCAEL